MRRLPGERVGKLQTARLRIDSAQDAYNKACLWLGKGRGAQAHVGACAPQAHVRKGRAHLREGLRIGAARLRTRHQRRSGAVMEVASQLRIGAWLGHKSYRIGV